MYDISLYHIKSIEIKSEWYTYRYDFRFNRHSPENPGYEGKVESEPISSADESLQISLDLLRCVFGKDKVRDALESLHECDY